MTTQARVLVVDDDPVVARSIDRVLTGKGYAVITASGGTEALEKLAQEKYDAVFTDIRMPGMDGFEVAKRIKATQPWLPVVIVTGYGSPESKARAKELGVAGFLHKPLSPDMIEGSAREVLLRKAQASACAGRHGATRRTGACGGRGCSAGRRQGREERGPVRGGSLHRARLRARLPVRRARAARPVWLSGLEGQGQVGKTLVGFLGAYFGYAPRMIR